MIVVPEVTPLPEMDEPTGLVVPDEAAVAATSVPEVTEVTVSVVPEIEPVKLAETLDGSKLSVVVVLFATMPSTPEYVVAIFGAVQLISVVA